MPGAGVKRAQLDKFHVVLKLLDTSLVSSSLVPAWSQCVPDHALRQNMWLRVRRLATLRSDCELSSAELGVLQPGAVVEVLEARVVAVKRCPLL